MASEKTIEKKLYDRVKTMNGLALKMICLTFTGLPDRTILLPGGRIYFAELKSTGKTQSPRQILVTKQLRKLGFKVYVIDSNETLEAFFNDIK